MGHRGQPPRADRNQGRRGGAERRAASGASFGGASDFFFAAFKVHISCAFGRSTGKSPHQRLLIRRQGLPLACWADLRLV
jgi:hypothetical protein